MWQFREIGAGYRPKSSKVNKILSKFVEIPAKIEASICRLSSDTIWALSNAHDSLWNQYRGHRFYWNFIFPVHFHSVCNVFNCYRFFLCHKNMSANILQNICLNSTNKITEYFGYQVEFFELTVSCVNYITTGSYCHIPASCSINSLFYRFQFAVIYLSDFDFG